MQATKKMTKSKLTPDDRDRILKDSKLQDKKAKLENQFRKALLKECVYTVNSMPLRKTQKIEDDDESRKPDNSKAKRKQEEPIVVKEHFSAHCLDEDIQPVKLTDEDLFTGLGISGLNQAVMAYLDPETDKYCKPAPTVPSESVKTEHRSDGEEADEEPVDL